MNKVKPGENHEIISQNDIRGFWVDKVNENTKEIEPSNRKSSPIQEQKEKVWSLERYKKVRVLLFLFLNEVLLFRTIAHKVGWYEHFKNVHLNVVWNVPVIELVLQTTFLFCIASIININLGGFCINQELN